MGSRRIGELDAFGGGGPRTSLSLRPSAATALGLLAEPSCVSEQVSTPEAFDGGTYVLTFLLTYLPTYAHTSFLTYLLLTLRGPADPFWTLDLAPWTVLGLESWTLFIFAWYLGLP